MDNIASAFERVSNAIVDPVMGERIDQIKVLAGELGSLVQKVVETPLLKIPGVIKALESAGKQKTPSVTEGLKPLIDAMSGSMGTLKTSVDTLDTSINSLGEKIDDLIDNLSTENISNPNKTTAFINNMESLPGGAIGDGGRSAMRTELI